MKTLFWTFAVLFLLGCGSNKMAHMAPFLGNWQRIEVGTIEGTHVTKVYYQDGTWEESFSPPIADGCDGVFKGTYTTTDNIITHLYTKWQCPNIPVTDKPLVCTYTVVNDVLNLKCEYQETVSSDYSFIRN